MLLQALGCGGGALWEQAAQVTYAGGGRRGERDGVKGLSTPGLRMWSKSPLGAGRSGNLGAGRGREIGGEWGEGRVLTLEES